jgi:predicted 2-oxoglutarate/Fe(II)-dependent dioxygenase YbiX
MQLPRSSCTREDVLVCDNAIPEPELEWLRTAIAQAELKDSLVSQTGAAVDSQDVRWTIDKRVRDTQEVQLSNEAVAKLDAILSQSIRAHIDAFFHVTVRDWEPIQVLHYGAGGHYIPHVDAETLFTDDIGLEMWEKTLDRDLSVVYFLNDEFDGGELYFPVLDLLIKPRAGTLVCFPSDHHFVHGVKSVTSGHRYTAVTWMRVTDMPSMEEINETWLGEYERSWPNQVEQPSHIASARRARLKQQ